MERLTAAELKTALKQFESELRKAGLSDNTVTTYIGRSETFIRWLAGEYTPRGPNTVATEKLSRSRGLLLLDELRDRLSEEEIKGYLRDYAAVTGYDKSSLSSICR